MRRYSGKVIFQGRAKTLVASVVASRFAHYMINAHLGIEFAQAKSITMVVPPAFAPLTRHLMRDGLPSCRGRAAQRFRRIAPQALLDTKH